MDPQASLYGLLEELASENPDRVIVCNYLEALGDWVNKGGVLPEVKQNPLHLSSPGNWTVYEETEEERSR